MQSNIQIQEWEKIRQRYPYWGEPIDSREVQKRKTILEYIEEHCDFPCEPDKVSSYMREYGTKQRSSPGKTISRLKILAEAITAITGIEMTKRTGFPPIDVDDFDIRRQFIDSELMRLSQQDQLRGSMTGYFADLLWLSERTVDGDLSLIRQRGNEYERSTFPQIEISFNLTDWIILLEGLWRQSLDESLHHSEKKSSFRR